MNIFFNSSQRRTKGSRNTRSHCVDLSPPGGRRSCVQQIEWRTLTRGAPWNSNSSSTLTPWGAHEESQIPIHWQWNISEDISLTFPNCHNFIFKLCNDLIFLFNCSKLRLFQASFFYSHNTTYIPFPPPGQQVAHTLLPHYSTCLLARLMDNSPKNLAIYWTSHVNTPTIYQTHV